MYGKYGKGDYLYSKIVAFCIEFFKKLTLSFKKT